MAEQQVVESEQLESRVQSLCDAIDEVADSNLPGRDDLGKIWEVLKEIKARIVTPAAAAKDDGDEVLLPQSKMEELRKLLPTIQRALQQRKKQPRELLPPEAEHPAAVSETKKLPAAIGCSPSCLKPRPSQQQSKESTVEEQDEAGVSLKLLLRLTQDVLEPVQYYEWTTSYVDESRIYGLEKQADELAAALVAGDGDEVLFRAAGIAGVHGSGKTALAQKVFVHDKSKDNFALRLWVCVGPPDSEDRFGLLYRMLDNLGLDTAKVEGIVDNSGVVVKARRQAVEASSIIPNGDDIAAKLSREEVEESRHVQNSKIGVLLYMLHMTLSKTSYLIVFDDIRAYGDDGWYSNLTLAPPAEGEWGDRLAYGLPKPKAGGGRRAAVLLTCRNEEHARSMVRNGRVVRPPSLDGKPAWKLFKREYRQAKAKAKAKAKAATGDDYNNKDDMLYKELKEMKKNIVDKCLGLPVAIAEAAKGFAALQPLPPDISSDDKSQD